jgi:predicted acetyltransferase
MGRIHQQCYPNDNITLEERIERFRSNPRIALEDHWVCESNGRLMGMFALYPFRMYRSGMMIPTGGIGLVAVPPEARRGGVAYEMMAKAIEIMDQNNMPLSILHPFRHSFYRKLGWGLVGENTVFRFSPRNLPDFPERENVLPVITTDEYEAVMTCYHQYASRQNGLLARDDPYWYEIVFKNAHCYAYIDPTSGAVEGYLTFRYKPHPWEQAFMTSDFTVWDFVWNSRRALHGLLGFLGAQTDQIESIIFPGQVGLPLAHLLKEPLMPKGSQNMVLGAETATLGSTMMGRIVQLRRTLKVTGKLGDAPGKVTLNIHDDMNPANAEPVTLDIQDGQVEFLPASQKADIQLNTDMSTFSAMFWGALKLTDAVVLGLVELEGKGDAGFLKRMFTAPKPICFDHF